MEFHAQKYIMCGIIHTHHTPFTGPDCVTLYSHRMRDDEIINTLTAYYEIARKLWLVNDANYEFTQKVNFFYAVYEVSHNKHVLKQDIKRME